MWVPNRRASEVRKKTPEMDLSGPPVVDLSVPVLARLALGAGHYEARNGSSLASCRLSPVLELEGAARPTRPTAHFERGPRFDPQDVPGESMLGCTPHPRRTSQTRDRHRREQRHQIHGAVPQASVSDLAHNHAKQLVSVDFFTVPTIRFQILYLFLVLAHDRRRILHFNRSRPHGCRVNFQDLGWHKIVQTNQRLGDQPSPAGLMACATATARVAMEVLMEWD